MIQRKLMKILEKDIPGLVWSVNYYALDDNTGTVYSTGGPAPDIYDTEYRYPTYQVYIRSSDWDFAETAAYMVFNKLHKKRDFRVTTSYRKDGISYLDKEYYVHLIKAASDPIRIGPADEVMEYSVNFDVTLKELKEE